jgi:hypothetical protein
VRLVRKLGFDGDAPYRIVCDQSTNLRTGRSRQALSTCMVPTLSSSWAQALACVGDARKAMCRSVSTSSAARISARRASTEGCVRSTL